MKRVCIVPRSLCLYCTEINFYREFINLAESSVNGFDFLNRGAVDPELLECYLTELSCLSYETGRTFHEKYFSRIRNYVFLTDIEKCGPNCALLALRHQRTTRKNIDYFLHKRTCRHPPPVVMATRPGEGCLADLAG